MTIKQRLATYLMEHRGECISGNMLANTLGCTRAAIWKAIHELEAEGYEIQSNFGKGYSLKETMDRLDDTVILQGVTHPLPLLEVHQTIGSTNTRLKELASEGAREWTTIIAAQQTQGRGRMGRSFYSPSNTGLYMSVLLRPTLLASSAVDLTTAAAVAVAEAIESLTGKQTQIKWVNDIYLDKKKVCGILTEASCGLETGMLEYAVLGIGINVYPPEGGFPTDIQDIATAIMEKKSEQLRNRLVCEILNRFLGYYMQLSAHHFLEGYRARLMWKNERIALHDFHGSIESVTLLDVDEHCRLLVKGNDNTIRPVESGEISIRRTV